MRRWWQVLAAPQPVSGRDHVARFVLSARRFAPGPFAVEISPINGKPAILLRLETGRVFLVISVDVSENQIQTLHIIGNPDKLSHL